MSAGVGVNCYGIVWRLDADAPEVRPYRDRGDGREYCCKVEKLLHWF